MMKSRFGTSLVLSLLFLASCGENSALPVAVTVNPGSLAATAGDAATSFTATAQNSDEVVSWSLSGVGSLSTSSGLTTVYTPPSTLDNTQSATLTATLGNASKNVLITVSPDVAGPPATPPTDPDPPADPDPPTDPDPPSDTGVPKITSVQPASGATGVAADANIVVTFSEKMDRAATQAAYQSADLPAGSVTFSWNDKSTALTVRPNAPLTYATGDDPGAVVAKQYSFAITNTAKDAAGNTLPFTQSGFSTFKQIGVALNSQPTLDGDVGRAYGVYRYEEDILVGDAADNTSSRGFLSFDLSSVPAEVAGTQVLKAELSAYYWSYSIGGLGTPYTTLGGQINLEHVSYGGTLVGSAYDTPTLSDLGLFTKFETPFGHVAKNVLGAVQDDLAKRGERGERSQYRLRFPQETDNDSANDSVEFRAGEAWSEQKQPLLKLTYLLP